MHNRAALLGYIDGKITAKEGQRCYQLTLRPTLTFLSPSEGINDPSVFKITVIGLDDEDREILERIGLLVHMNCAIKSYFIFDQEGQPHMATNFITDAKKDRISISHKGRSFGLKSPALKDFVK